jgi:hypothetical protein
MFNGCRSYRPSINKRSTERQENAIDTLLALAWRE